MRLWRRLIEHDDWINDSPPRELGNGVARPVVGALREDDPAKGGSRARLHVGEKRHDGGANVLARNAAATAGCTRLETSPPNRAISRTRLALMYVVSSDGTM